ncbi:hypothetical protein K402DRAFT_113829 [Aulographum hederae CBS 113979]|uniref:Xylanolytic transcriptional activator regulatory domain-containing protein n=1 Tax=Aulographum hederae CBS 113979 TaxID=1176131 RepID=A0A6G1GWX1_9PEZI|nr:hypothetical protein K402DRAFT_113829 [Aulographum hederae CBS 113979]
MLQDPTGRLLYVGDSASLSFLQLIRMIVEKVAGPSLFTQDPRRHKIAEGPFTLQPSASRTHLLPDRMTAKVLVDSFFINTHGLLQVFDRDRFLSDMDNCFLNPLSVEPSYLCLLNLVFAIGLIEATPRPSTPDAMVVERLRSEHIDRAELFYLNAKGLNDPLSGFEDADFWSIQALLLMSFYMLCKTKRNNAFALLGMAVRSGFALGLHREETMPIFSPEIQVSRRNLWRSLFVMDRFLCCSLGRPPAITEKDCSPGVLQAHQLDESSPGTNEFSQTAAYSLDAAVRSSSVIGTILRRVYQQRKTNTTLASEIADQCKLWPQNLAPTLHWREAPGAPPSQGIAILHVNLFYCHSIILLTRPFFLFVFNANIQRVLASQGGSVNNTSHSYARMEKFSEACVIASTHTVVLVQNALDAGYLPRRNPIVIYFLFAAALVVLSNEFGSIHPNAAADQCIGSSIAVIQYCAETDPQASRLNFILTTFRDVVQNQRTAVLRQQKAHTTAANLAGAAARTEQAAASPTTSIFPDTPRSETLKDLVHEQQKQQPPLQPILPITPDAPPTSFGPGSGSKGVLSFATSVAPQPTSSSANFIPQSSDFYPTFGRTMSMSNVLDLSALENTNFNFDPNSADQQIDFDALWAWPSNTPATGSPRMDAQGISDSAVPLFGVLDS